MTTSTSELVQLTAALESLRDEMHQMNQRVATLESHLAAERSRGAASQDELTEEIVAVITATVAAYLGVKPIIRQIRLRGSASWVELGRATIQASHRPTSR